MNVRGVTHFLDPINHFLFDLEMGRGSGFLLMVTRRSKIGKAFGVAARLSGADFEISSLASPASRPKWRS